ncbi:MAG TPA: SET domain-containing protein-lysine N-methyltransferase [Flavobacteriaceae bacterium]|nr:SET domain-containing protein-lysine N-methyltransferase [Flavobacteriaceae bacterium]MAY54177.1 SET domain-containing protein-lysine N-methyltransferase [Flavobacteriaceae bacterium]HBR52817.1 SET domain-containing protein-lysine N-methyltransferase [Flavobacteriaceae bacterium]
MIHPHTELRFINDEIGHGVVATQFIPAGTITWVLDALDREFTLQQFQQFDPLYQNILDTYSYRNSKGNYVLCWDHGRFVNHSFKSNCLSTAYDFEIAVRDIQSGEQLTDDYGYLNVDTPFRASEEGTKRKTVYPDDLKNYHSVWDKKIAAVFPKIPTLDQPLEVLLSADTKNTIHKVNNGEESLASILEIYYKRQ